MQFTGNTIFITGATSGVGRALVEAFHHLGNQASQPVAATRCWTRWSTTSTPR